MKPVECFVFTQEFNFWPIIKKKPIFEIMVWFIVYTEYFLSCFSFQPTMSFRPESITTESFIEGSNSSNWFIAFFGLVQEFSTFIIIIHEFNIYSWNESKELSWTSELFIQTNLHFLFDLFHIFVFLEDWIGFFFWIWILFIAE